MMINTTLTLLSASQIRAFYAAGYWSDQTIYLAAREQARRNPQAYAIRDRRRRLTYGELIAAADGLAADLHAAGVRPGQRVGVWMPSRVETAIALLACSRNSYTCCPSLHRDHTAGDIAGLMKRVRAAAFIGETGYGADARRHDIFELLKEQDSLRRVIRIERVADDTSGIMLPSCAESQPEPSDDPNRVVYLAFTSGTTGQPKGVMHSDNTLLSNARAMAKDWSFGSESVLYTMSPLSHNLGFGAMISAFATGAELVVHDQPRGTSILDRLLETGSTFLFGVPTHAIDLLSELREREASNVGRLTGFRISGASAPKEVVAELLRYGVKPQSGYGMTEACSHHYTLPDDPPERIIQTSGKACENYEVKIWSIDDPNREAAPGEIGQIGGRGASLMLGYFDDQAATESSFNQSGWFMTGDLGKQDADGYLVITGRKKELIIRGGHNIYPARIENLTLQHPAVARAAVVPVPDTRLGEKVCLAYSLRDGQSTTFDELLRHLDASGLSRYDMPEYMVELKDIPLTASGKIYKRALVDDVQHGRLNVTPVRFQPAQQA
ncbi:MAG: class I adenylate-forming enzyme family protein [Pigmentiphaga sp.]|uniref:class I adenylate-forming enzyme family protein n=1 Tax=Pigmentiphaga sp. TaxID=1977564 RepID=UPI0029A61EB7|nr:class I adenylate-forming enzyme family protein [Pigmentiphaga sp.]MDX3908045.1 class I adenylate-forming enzyme family protein [Pigmentiphaga sp.]